MAEIKDDFAEISEDIVLNGGAAMAVIVQKQSDGNTVAVSNAVREAIPEIQKTLPLTLKFLNLWILQTLSEIR